MGSTPIGNATSKDSQNDRQSKNTARSVLLEQQTTGNVSPEQKRAIKSAMKPVFDLINSARDEIVQELDFTRTNTTMRTKAINRALSALDDGVDS